MPLDGLGELVAGVVVDLAQECAADAVREPLTTTTTRFVLTIRVFMLAVLVLVSGAVVSFCVSLPMSLASVLFGGFAATANAWSVVMGWRTLLMLRRRA